ncbi:MAG: MBOAT family protein [Bacteroidales bacterium]|nr:MBOAT family protein [Candidatus Sodaliphilus aphodohippi]
MMGMDKILDMLASGWRNLDWNIIVSLLTYDSNAPMIFSSGIFLWLFAGFIVVYAFLHRNLTARLLFVTAFSYYFYYKSSGFYFFLLAVVTVSDFLIARGIGGDGSKARRKWLVALSLIIDLGLLGWFKYTNFLGHAFAGLTGGTFTDLNIFLPVGISFFTFQSLSYTIDVYRRRIKPLDSLLDYAFYVSFFPQLVAGPIVRASDFIPQIRRPLHVTRNMVGMGIWLIVCGLFKKAVISDFISVNFVERIFDNPTLYSGLENLVGVYGYALQIYCDFSGYSDMAIGIALLLGFHFNINFNSPYKSASITEFWRHWHISLSTWLRDYLYISLGGNRKGKLRQYLNLLITMLLGGLWHGASWNFVAWGGLHGVALALHKMWMSLTGSKTSGQTGKWLHALSVFITFNFVCLCWIFFRNREFDGSVKMLTQIFTNFHPELLGQLITGYGSVMAMIVLGYALHFVPAKWETRCKRAFVKMPAIVYVLVLIAMVFIIAQVKTSDVQPFIYFQF